MQVASAGPAIIPERSATSRLWLVSPGFDLLIYSGIVFYSAVLVLALGRVFEPSKLFVWFNIAFTMAHYFPTWSRAYLDRAMFREYRWQILLFPVLFAAMAFGARTHPVALVFLTYFWDRFHAVMQNYGFLRLYDSRLPVEAKIPWGLEMGLVFAAAITVMSFNIGLLVPFLGQLYLIGLPLFAQDNVVLGLRAVCLTVTVVLAIAYGWRLFRHGVTGLPKIVYLVSMVGGHVLMNATTNVLLLVCHEKVYHSTQYIALTWFYNQRKANKAPPSIEAAKTDKTNEAKPEELGRVYRALFQGRGPWRYLAMTALWAASFYLLTMLVSETAAVYALSGTFTLFSGCIALTHYYFDSFLWRIRRPEVQANL